MNMDTDSSLTSAEESSIELAASMEFEPWDSNSGLQPEDLASNRNVHLMNARIALSTMYMTKAEMIGRIDGDESIYMLRTVHDAIEDSAAAFREIAETMDSARTRLLVAMSAYATKATP